MTLSLILRIRNRRNWRRGGGGDSKRLCFHFAEIDRNTPPSKMSPHLNSFRGVPTPKQEHYERTRYKSSFKLKRIYHKKMCADLMKCFRTPENSKKCFTFAFYSAMNLTFIINIASFNQKLENDRDLLYAKSNWNLPVREYLAHLVNLVELTSKRWDQEFRKTGQK